VSFRVLLSHAILSVNRMKLCNFMRSFVVEAPNGEVLKGSILNVPITTGNRRAACFQRLKSRYFLFSQWRNREPLYIRGYAANFCVEIRLYSITVSIIGASSVQKSP
jgi:hypothetical protein